ncbi:MAG TPA: NlpC/P60 family protein, partial [Micromonosporaceae bacterium]|nr:NlpC/P60 family protein [Micromonosporaceae bacterium]
MASVVLRQRFTRRPATTLAVALVALLSLSIVLTGATPAGAEPSVSDIEKQIDEAWNKLEPVIEKHNAARQDLAAKRKQAQALARRIQPLELQIQLAMEKVGDLAVRAYKGEQTSAVNAILSSGTPDAFLNQLELLDQFARRQHTDVQAVLDLKEKLATQKRPLDQLVTQLAQSEAELAAKKKQINAEIKRLQELRLQVYGSSTSLGSLRPAPCPSTYPGGAAGKAITFACAQIGKPYVWGADGPGSYDCSGLSMRAWAQGGIYLPHNAAAQRRAVRSVSRSELRPGDLVFY